MDLLNVLMVTMNKVYAANKLYWVKGIFRRTSKEPKGFRKTWAQLRKFLPWKQWVQAFFHFHCKTPLLKKNHIKVHLKLTANQTNKTLEESSGRIKLKLYVSFQITRKQKTNREALTWGAWRKDEYLNVPAKNQRMKQERIFQPDMKPEQKAATEPLSWFQRKYRSKVSPVRHPS